MHTVLIRFFSDPRSIVGRVLFIVRLLWTTLGDGCGDGGGGGGGGRGGGVHESCVLTLVQFC